MIKLNIFVVLALMTSSIASTVFGLRGFLETYPLAVKDGALMAAPLVGTLAWGWIALSGFVSLLVMLVVVVRMIANDTED